VDLDGLRAIAGGRKKKVQTEMRHVLQFAPGRAGRAPAGDIASFGSWT
jgi:hypothetical protein